MNKIIDSAGGFALVIAAVKPKMRWSKIGRKNLKKLMNIEDLNFREDLI